MVDCGFWGGLVPEPADLEGLIRAGVLGLNLLLLNQVLTSFP